MTLFRQHLPTGPSREEPDSWQENSSFSPWGNIIEAGCPLRKSYVYSGITSTLANEEKIQPARPYLNRASILSKKSGVLLLTYLKGPRWRHSELSPHTPMHDFERHACENQEKDRNNHK